jgi:tetratricopeptide (TPR) repeat protein
MRASRIFVILASAALAATLLPAQKGGPTGGATTGTGATGTAGTTGTTGTTPNLNIPTTSPNSTNSTNSSNLPSRGAFYFGKVVMPDGTAPPSGVVIERVCNGTARPQAYADSRGEFSFQIGQTQDMMPDATVDTDFGRRGDAGGVPGGQQGTQRLGSSPFNCDLRANLAGYRSDVINLAGRRSLDDPNVGTIMLHSMAHYEGLTTSATSALAPKDARKSYEKGLDALKKSKIDEAQADFLKAAELYPRYASAWYELGVAYEKNNRVPEARDAYAKSIAADSRFVNPYERLYMLSFADKNWEDVARVTNQVMHLNPYDFPESLYFNAVANSQLMRLDAAEKSAREAVQLSATQNPKVYYILAVILTKKQDFKGAAECLHVYLRSDVVTDREGVKRMLADVEKQVQARAELKPQP